MDSFLSAGESSWVVFGIGVVLGSFDGWLDLVVNAFRKAGGVWYGVLRARRVFLIMALRHCLHVE